MIQEGTLLVQLPLNVIARILAFSRPSDLVKHKIE